jgi:hypothetical protein
MFVRFRKSANRLQISLARSSRAGCKVLQEHVASLGTIADPPSVQDRIEFWRRLPERTPQSFKRLDGAAQAELLGQIHARVPQVTSENDRLPLGIAMSINVVLSLSLWVVIGWSVDSLL